jgi:hypothetical protein
VLTNELSRLTPNPLVIYAALAVYGMILLMVVAYVYAKFRTANRMLKVLKQDWAHAETKHTGFIDQAREQITRLRPPTISQTTMPSDAINGDLRNQIITMGRKGMAANEIARSCGIPEGDVDVMLGLARIEVTSR